MKILYIIHDNKRGGAALSFLDMLNGINGRCEVVVLTPHRKGFIPEQLKALNIKHLSLYYTWWEISAELPLYIRLIYKVVYKWNIIAAHIIAKRIRKMNIDIIHSNSSTINIGGLISNLSGIPHIWHLRELGDLDFNLSPISSRDSFNSILNTGQSYFIAISEYVKHVYAQYIPPEHIVKIYNGISDSYNLKKECSGTGELIKFLISGNYSEAKGQLDVIKAVGELVGRSIDNFKVYMAGSGDYKEVNDYIIRNNLNEYVEILGLVEDVRQLRLDVDVEIVASKAEAFGRVTIESMRSSNPVIGADTGATSELIIDGRTGFLYELGNIKQLADRMSSFISNPRLVRELGDEAYIWSKNRFSSRENIEAVLTLYRQVIAN